MKKVQNIAKRNTKTQSEQMLLGKRCSTQGCCQLSICKKNKYTISAKCNKTKHAWIALLVLKMRKLRLKLPILSVSERRDPNMAVFSLTSVPPFFSSPFLPFTVYFEDL